MSSKDQDSAAVEVLTRIAAGDQDLRSELTCDASELVRCAAMHRLTGRLLGAIQLSEPAWASRSLVQQLNELFQKDLQNWTMRRVAAQEVSRECADFQPIFLKGFSNLYIRDPWAVRGSHDLDIMANDENGLTEALINRGFRSSPTTAQHTHINLEREPIYIDVHRHFPVHRVPNELTVQDLDPTSNPGVWFQRGRIEFSPIEHRDLQPFVVPVHDNLRREKIQIPLPAMALVLYAAHAFREFTLVGNLGGRFKPQLRLWELAEIRQLATHPKFDTPEFLSIVDEFAAIDVIAWVDCVMGMTFRSRPLARFVPRLDSEDFETRFPRNLRGSFWVTLHRPVLDLLRGPMPLRAIFEQLGSNQLTLREGEQLQFSTASDDLPGAQPLTRLLVGGSRSVPPLHLTLEVKRKTLDFTILALRFPWKAARIWIDFAHAAVICDLESDKGETAIREVGISGVNVSQSRSGSNLTVELSFPRWPLLADWMEDEIDVLISIESGYMGQGDLSLLLPLTLFRNS